jgi:hypothetical protein
MMIKKYAIFLVSAYWVFILPCFSQLQVANIFIDNTDNIDNMVLQRNQPIKIWGKSIPGQKVNVVFGSLMEDTITKKD